MWVQQSQPKPGHPFLGLACLPLWPEAWVSCLPWGLFCSLPSLWLKFPQLLPDVLTAEPVWWGHLHLLGGDSDVGGP